MVFLFGAKVPVNLYSSGKRDGALPYVEHYLSSTIATFLEAFGSLNYLENKTFFILF